LQFSENAVRYEASLNFLSDRINGLRKALKGE
jgi:flagellar basal body rod protein FlgB